MRGVILFILFSINIMCTLSLFTILIARNMRDNFFMVNENIIYFAMFVIISNTISVGLLIDKTK